MMTAARRIKRMRITGQFLLSWFVSGFPKEAELYKNPLPPDVRLIHAEMDYRGDLVMTLESETWPELPEGNVPCYVDHPVFRQVVVRLEQQGIEI